MAGLIEKLIGHEHEKSWLLDQLKKDELPSSLIFQGPSGIGKRTLALGLLQVINCRVVEDGACGECSNCMRCLEERNEMIYNLTPEGKKTIGVDQVRDVHHFLSLRSVQKARFIIIDPADSLSTPAANSLLKVLEESPENTHFILISEQIRGLLPTIRSRSHMLKFAKLSKEQLQSAQDFDPVALNWSDGRLHMAIDLQSAEMVDQLNNSLRFLYSLICEHPQDWKKVAPWFFNDDQAREFGLQVWNQALEKRMYNTQDDLQWLPEDRGQVSRLYEQVEFLKSDISRNVDKLLAVENFYYNLRSEV